MLFTALICAAVSLGCVSHTCANGGRMQRTSYRFGRFHHDVISPSSALTRPWTRLKASQMALSCSGELPTIGLDTIGRCAAHCSYSYCVHSRPAYRQRAPQPMVEVGRGRQR